MVWNMLRELVKGTIQNTQIQKGLLSASLVSLVSMGALPQAWALDSQGASNIEPLTASISNEEMSSVVNRFDKISPKFRSRHFTGLLPIDAEALNGRQPLVLVHGIGGADGSRYSEWDEFLTYAKERPEFLKQFKIYLFHYDSGLGVTQLSYKLQQDLTDFLKTISPYQKIKLVGYSEGGLLVRNAMQAPAVNHRVEQVITLATPFHGSPLASKSWFTAQVNQEAWLAPLRVSRRIAYWVTAKKHPNFETDFHWDNIDEAIDKSFLMDKVPSPTDYVLQYKPEFITYGSFFGTSNTVDEQMVKSLALAAPLPNERHAVYSLKSVVFNVVNHSIGRIGGRLGKIVAQAQTEEKPSTDMAAKIEDSHVLLAAANQAIEDATIPEPAQASDAAISTISMMPFNDGISPISSSLWLGRFSAQTADKNPSNRLWDALRFLKGKDKARLFPGMDHRNWIENQTRMASNQVPDLLNPQHDSRTVFDWLIYDLMSHQN